MKNKVLIVLLILAAVGVAFFVARGSYRAIPGETAMSTTTMVTLPVKGMTCASCQATVTEGLSKLPGVLRVAVSLEDETAIITYDRNSVMVPSLVEAIEALGYASAVPPENQLQVIDFKMKIN